MSNSELNKELKQTIIALVVSFLLIFFAILASSFLRLLLSYVFGLLPMFDTSEIIENPSDLEKTLLIGSVSSWFLIGYAYKKYKDFEINHSLSYPNSRTVLVSLLLTATAVLINYLSNILENALDLQVQGIQFLQDPSSAVLILFVFMTSLFVAPAEEYFFRGIIQSKFVYILGPIKGILMSSILFAIVHIPNFLITSSIIGITYTMVFTYIPLGIVFGYGYEKSENLFVPIISHALYNISIVTIAFLIS